MKPTKDEILRYEKRAKEAKKAFEKISKRMSKITEQLRSAWIEFYDAYEKIKNKLKKAVKL